MKGAVGCIVLSLAAVGVLSGSFYGEKENAIMEVKDKFGEFEKFTENVLKHFKDEEQKNEKEIENQVTQTLNTEKTTAVKKLTEEVSGAVRTAIAKGKPLSVIDCITKAAFEAREAVDKVEENIRISLKNIKSQKENALIMTRIQIDLIKTATKELKDQSIDNIEKAKDGFQALKTDAIKKIDAAKKQMQELEVRIPKPDLKNDLLTLKRQIEPKFQEVLTNLVKKLQKC